MITKVAYRILRIAIGRVLVVLMLGLAVSAEAAAGQTTVSSAEQVLEPGDSVRIIVWRQPELSGGFLVSSDETLSHPLFQQVVVGGVPFDTARAHFAAVLKKYVQDPLFVMEPFFRVVAVGEVRQPGIYALPRRATLAQAIAAAGGPTQSGRLDHVTLVRHGSVIQVDLTNVADPMANSLILSGDRLVVPRQTDILRNYVAPMASVIAALAVLVNVLRH